MVNALALLMNPLKHRIDAGAYSFNLLSLDLICIKPKTHIKCRLPNQISI